MDAKTCMQRLLSPGVYDQVLSGALVVERGRCKEQTVTMLTASLRGFTAMAENMKANAVLAMLESYYDVMHEVLLEHGGTLDKFAGDWMLALFGAPSPTDEAPFKAVRCAIAMQQRLSAPQRIGIGIHTGPVVTGFIGSTHMLQYTAIGDAVNTAARIGDLAKAGQIIVSESTMSTLADRVAADDLGAVEVKGKTRKLHLFSVIRLTA